MNERLWDEFFEMDSMHEEIHDIDIQILAQRIAGELGIHNFNVI